MKGPLILVVAMTAAFVVFVLLVTREDGEPSAKPLSQPELGWVRKHSTWSAEWLDKVMQAYGVATKGGSGRKPVELFEDFPSCADRLEAEVGDPPTEELGDVLDEARGGCAEAEKATEALRGAAYFPDPEVANRITEAAQRLNKADYLVSRRLLIERTAGLSARPTQLEVRLGRVATAVTGLRVRVRCWSRSRWRKVERELAAVGAESNSALFGLANLWEGTAHLSPSVCASLGRFTAQRRIPAGKHGRRDLIEAVMTLAHEAHHAPLNFDEQAVECYALQDVRGTAQRLGARRGQADRLALAAWSLYRVNALAPGLRTPGCRNGGPLDTSPAPRWP